MKVEITWTIIVLGTLLHSTQSDTPTQSIPTDPTLQTNPTDQSPQSDPTDPSSQSNPTDPPPHSNPTNPTPQSDPTDLSPQSNPTVPPSQSDPAHPAPQSDSADLSPQSNPTDPHVQSKPTDPSPQSNPTDSPAQFYPTEGVPLTHPAEPATKTSPTDPPHQSNPADPPPQTDPTDPPALSSPTDPLPQSNPAYPHAPSNPANPPTQMNTTDPPPQSNPADPTTQSDPDVPHRQTDPTDLHKQRHIVNNSNAESVNPAAPDSISTVTPSQQTLEAQTSTIPMTSAPHQTNNNFISTSKTENKTTETFTRDFDLSENSKEDVLLETCKTLGQKIIGKCSVKVEIKDKQLVATIKIDADQYIPKEHYKASPKTEQEDAIKETIPDTLIAILASCGALVLILCCFAAYCTYHRRSYRKNQQHLTEELQTVENGYHDNPTLEVMEVQPEMQEKKVSLNRDFNDSWIVPIDNLLKEDMVDEEDTHL